MARPTISAPLRLNPLNPRYFADGEGRGVLLTGFHTWSNLVEIYRKDNEQHFDFVDYLDRLDALDHNFIRLWAWDALCSWNPEDRVHPFPWARTGPGLAIDGKPQVDFETFDEEYFDRLRTRVGLAQERGIYVGVMLFDSWVTRDVSTTPHEWHITAAGNNINGIDVLPSLENHWLLGWMGLADPAILAIQERYVERVVRELNGFPNVIYEVSNEAGGLSYRWQEHIVRHVRLIEKDLPQQHLVGITGGMGTMDEDYFRVDADYLAPEGWSPNEGDSPYRDGFALWGASPERCKGPVLLDTDHLWGIGGNVRWAWQSFLRGYHVLYMDPITDLPSTVFVHPWWPDPTNIELRAELGALQRLAAKLDLNQMVPDPDRYALVGPGVEVILSLDGQPVPVHLDGETQVEWQQVAGPETAQQRIRAEAGTTLPNPWSGDAIALVRSL